MEYQEIIERMPRYPILEAQIRKSPLSFEEIAKQAHIRPARLRAHLDGTTKRGETIRLHEVVALKQVLGFRSIDALIYTPAKQISEQMEDAIAAVAVVLRDDLGLEALEKAKEPLKQFEQWQLHWFLISLIEHAADIVEGISADELLPA